MKGDEMIFPKNMFAGHNLDDVLSLYGNIDGENISYYPLFNKINNFTR